MSVQIILLLLTIILLITWVGTVVSDDIKKENKEKEDMENELDHKRKAGQL